MYDFFGRKIAKNCPKRIHYQIELAFYDQYYGPNCCYPVDNRRFLDGSHRVRGSSTCFQGFSSGRVFRVLCAASVSFFLSFAVACVTSLGLLSFGVLRSEQAGEQGGRRRIRKGQQSWNLRISKLFQKRTSTACPP